MQVLQFFFTLQSECLCRYVTTKFSLFDDFNFVSPQSYLLPVADVFDSETSVSRTRLLNLLQQLRKCVNHPYLFDGVEPEPFELGEHLVEASAKLVMLDRILCQLRRDGHRVLLFSQMTRALDILQDYLHYRGTTAIPILNYRGTTVIPVLKLIIPCLNVVLMRHF